ncbi:MAG TPA: hypothetical protein VF041_21755 [Gemmatimonadaceae bacterium]
MSDAVLFSIVFVGFFALRIVFATVFFYFILPEGDRCPNCDTPTLRVRSRGWNVLLPWFRTSWCYNCQWEGLLRHGPITETPLTREEMERRQRDRNVRT